MRQLYANLENRFLISPKLIYFAVSTAYYALYLFRAKFIKDYLRLDDTTYGDISGVMAIVGFAGATLWSWIGDNSGRHRLVLMIICLGMSLSAEFLYFIAPVQDELTRTVLTAVVFGLYAIFVGGMMPLADYLVLKILSNRPGFSRDLYSRQCLFGTAAYGVTSYLVGLLVKAFKLPIVFFVLPASSLFAVGILFLCAPADQPKSWGMTPQPTTKEPEAAVTQHPLKTLLLNANFVFMLFVVFLTGSARAVMTTFLAKYWDETMRLTETQVGTAANFGIFLEIAIFAVGPLCIRLFGVYWMLLMAQLAMVLRAWAYVGMSNTTSVYFVYSVELLKGVGFGFTQVSGTKVAMESAPDELKATAQALYSAFYSQLPLVLTAFAGGRCYQLYGSDLLFKITAVMASLALGLCTMKYLADVLTVVSAKSLLVLHDGTVDEGLVSWLNGEDAADLFNVKNSDTPYSLIDPYSDKLSYENLLMVTTQLPASVSNEQFVEYAKRGGNVLWMLPMEHASLKNRTVKLAAEFGRELDVQPPSVMDYTDKDDSTNTTVRMVPETATRVFGKGGMLRYRGRSHRLISGNPLVFPVITARKEAIAVCPPTVGLGQCTPSFGADNVLVSALQTRLNSRITLISSDGWLRERNSAARRLADWTFQRSGQLTIESYQHVNLEGRSSYRIGDRMELTVCLKLDGKPMQPTDMQMELTMMDAWVRADLHPVGDCLSTGPVKLPDRYGTFTLSMRYQRKGWPHLMRKEKFIIRPVHYEEAVRFMLSAMPYYMSWIAMMATSAFLVFPFIFPSEKRG
ncbi:Major facilitator superfamily permease [Paramicrosporidium saccamoebae]|uniref:Dolichyl-diphosphooligosaccharide--protein glycosyltransferase subunit WBP1 n=1 Tax=Paramicrosporidium saccamoebae TaxID=1246581 RepID=A0A2H9TPU4_9FUNG|nr:Major facilitator superfamily permease [Paramicrosporidium saccamoebae]